MQLSFPTTFLRRTSPLLPFQKTTNTTMKNLILFFFLIFSSYVFCQSVNDPLYVQQLQVYTQYIGTQIGSAQDLPSYGGCVSYCCTYEPCNAWMWVADTSRNDTFSCYLYSDVTDTQTTNQVLYSGMRGSCSETINSSVITGATTTLTPDETRPNSTEQHCYEACIATAIYVTWAFDQTNSACELYILYPNLQYQVIASTDHVLGIQEWAFPDIPSKDNESDNKGVPQGVVIAVSTIGTLLFCTICSAVCFVIIRKRVKRSQYFQM